MEEKPRTGEGSRQEAQRIADLLRELPARWVNRALADLQRPEPKKDLPPVIPSARAPNDPSPED